MVERRKHVRIRMEVPIEISAEGRPGLMRCHTSDLSLGGCYVETMFTFPLNTKLQIHLWLHETRLTVEGLVVTCDPQVGNGISFSNMTEEVHAKLDSFVKCGALQW
jgi:c-di-GMP-binding flagellar brake protein YcgR